MRRPLDPLRPFSALSRVAAALLLAAVPASADTIRVPEDQPSIQAALYAAEPGDLVLVAGGTYEGTLQWFKKGGVTLRAKGKVTLRLPAGASASTPILEAHDISDVQLEGFRFVGTGKGVGLDLENVAGLVVRDCSFRDLGTGLRTGAACRGLLIADNELKDGGVGLEVNVQSSLIARNRILKSGGTGLDLLAGSHLVEDNRVRASGGTGVQIGESLVTLSRNSIRKSGGSDIDSAFGLGSVQLLDNDYGTLSTGF